MQTVAVTAASSFTGLWIANHLASKSFKVHALFTAEPKSGLKKIRLEYLDPRIHRHFGVRAEDGTMAGWVKSFQPHIWIHHHHFMENFRSHDYDLKRAETVGLKPLEGTVSALKDSGCKMILQSGTYFEKGEGGQDHNQSPSPYALSKEKVWSKLLDLRGTITLKKIIIPNPVGPFENSDRLIPNLIRSSLQKKDFHLRTPLTQVDNLSVLDLAATYESAIRSSSQPNSPEVFRPSGQVVSNHEFVNEVMRELIAKRLKLDPIRVEAAPNSESIRFQNSSRERIQSNWPAFWDFYYEKVRDQRYLDTLIDSKTIY